jgi:hypothetical protein
MSNMKLSEALHTIVPIYFKPNHSFLGIVNHFNLFKRIIGVISIMCILIFLLTWLFFTWKIALIVWFVIYCGPWAFYTWMSRNKNKYDKQMDEVILIASLSTGIELKRDKQLEDLVLSYYIDYVVKNNIAWL